MKAILHLLKLVVKFMWKVGIIGWDDVFAFAEEYSILDYFTK